MIIERRVAGERVTLNVLPGREAEPLWERWLAHVEASEGGVMGLDVETTGIDEVLGPFEPEAELRMVQFGSRKYAWALDPADPFWRERIDGLLNRTTPGNPFGMRFVSHTNYDSLWCHREFDVPVDERFIDTIVMAALLFPGVTVDKDLKFQCGEHIDTGLRQAELDLNVQFKDLAFDTSRLPKSFVGGKSPCRVSGCDETSWRVSRRGMCYGHHFAEPHVDRKLKKWGFTNIPLTDPVFGAYAGLDAIYVRRLLDIYSERLRKLNMGRLSKREQQIARLATNIRIRGMRVDQAWTTKILSEIEDEYEDAAARVSERLGGLPAGSPKRGDWLTERGVRFLEFTPTGAPKLTMPSAVAEGTLPELAERYADDEEVGPMLDDMLTMGTHKNILTNVRITARSAANDGRVHPEIKTQAAHTGRMSIVKPAMQTYKKNDPRLRGCHIADDGFVLVGADYDNQETRIAAAFSQDPALLRVVFEGLNQHELTAEMIFGLKPKQARQAPADGTRSPYDKAKTLDFAQQYGAGPARIGDQLGLPSHIDPESGRRFAHPEALSMWRAWREAYATLVEWTEHMAEFKIIVNPWGRRIPADKWRPYANGNYAIQSTGRELLGDAMVRLDDAGWGDAIWLPVHDELVLQVHEDEAEEACEILEQAMYAKIRNVELTATAQIIGNRWGAKAA